MTGRRRTNKADAKPTWTSLVEKALVESDDFMNMEQIVAATRASINQVSAALSHLAKRKAVEPVVGGNDKLWWFATPDTDDRSKKVEQRVPEEKGTRNRRKRATKETT